MTSYFRGEKIDTCLHENAQWFKKFLTMHKRIRMETILKLAPTCHCAINMMFKYKITEVKFFMLLHNYHDITVAENDAAA